MLYSISILVCGIALTSITLIMRLSNRKHETFFTILLVVVFSLIMANRSLEIPDTYWYQDSFTDLNPYQKYSFLLLQDNYRYGFEYGYIYFMQFFKRFISNDYRVFFFACSIIISFLFLYSFKFIYFYLTDEDTENINLPLFFCIYGCYFGLYYCGIAIRAGIAMGLILLGVVCALKKKFFLLAILLFVAFTIQRMSIVGVGVLLSVMFFKFIIEKKIVMIIWIIIGILIFTGIATRLFQFTLGILGSLFSRYSLDYYRYLMKGGQASEAGIAVFLDWVIGFIILVSIYDIKQVSRLFNTYLVGFVIIIFTLTIPGFNRISDYFTVVNIPMIYMFSTNSKINKLERICICILIVGMNIIRVLNRYGWV